jgi:RNA polymerase sigma factor for flagellar operon FliA
MPSLEDIQAYSTARVAAREQRIVDHLPLVKQIAASFAARVPRSVDAADLTSAGTVGLIRAVDAFDPDRGVAFEAFARRCIREAVLDHLRSLDPLPYSTRYRLRQVEACMLELEKHLSRLPTESEIADASGLSLRDVSNLMAQAASLTLYSLDELRDLDESRSEGDGREVLQRIEQKELRDVLAGLIRRLPRAERTALTLYYYEGLRMKEIGNLMNVSESRVSQIHARAVTMLRAQMREVLEQRGGR